MVGTEFGLVFEDKNLGERLKIGLDYFFLWVLDFLGERSRPLIIIIMLSHRLTHSLTVLVIAFESESLSLSFNNYIGSDHKAQPLLTSGSPWLLNRHN